MKRRRNRPSDSGSPESSNRNRPTDPRKRHPKPSSSFTSSWLFLFLLVTLVSVVAYFGYQGEKWEMNLSMFKLKSRQIFQVTWKPESSLLTQHQRSFRVRAWVCRTGFGAHFDPESTLDWKLDLRVTCWQAWCGSCLRRWRMALWFRHLLTIWFRFQVSNNDLGLRHWCEQGDNLKRYGWVEHNGEDYGRQELFDRGMKMTTSFVKRPGGSHGGDWTARIEVEADSIAKKK